MLNCDRCGLDFFDYVEFEIIPDEGTVCGHCLDEEEIMKEDHQQDEEDYK